MAPLAGSLYGFRSTLQWDTVGLGGGGTGISEPMPVAAAFHTPDTAGRTLADFTPFDSLVCLPP
jgi:hypothetical protein